MCGGIEYQDNKIYFPQPNARLPVLLRHGDVTWVTWGKRKNEDSGKFPNGGWARLNSIKAGKWKPWHPRPVLIPAVLALSWEEKQRFTITTKLTRQTPTLLTYDLWVNLLSHAPIKRNDLMGCIDSLAQAAAQLTGNPKQAKEIALAVVDVGKWWP